MYYSSLCSELLDTGERIKYCRSGALIEVEIGSGIEHEHVIITCSVGSHNSDSRHP
jgi:hypothetical protein